MNNSKHAKFSGFYFSVLKVIQMPSDNRKKRDQKKKEAAKNRQTKSKATTNGTTDEPEEADSPQNGVADADKTVEAIANLNLSMYL